MDERTSAKIYNVRTRKAESGYTTTTVERALIGFEAGKFDTAFLIEERAKENQRYAAVLEAFEKSDYQMNRLSELMRIARDERNALHIEKNAMEDKYGREIWHLNEPERFQKQDEMDKLNGKLRREARDADMAWEEAAKKEARRVRRKELREEHAAYKAYMLERALLRTPLA